MKVINIRKDGTVIDDMSDVTVPKDIAESVIKIIQERRKKVKNETLKKKGCAV